MKPLHSLIVALSLLSGSASGAAATPPIQRADFVVKPEVFMHHTPERSFIGPGMFQLANGDILMAAPWGRPPTNFEQIAAKFPVPILFRSADGGRTWKEQGRMKMECNLTGLISDGGTSFLRLRDGRIAVVFNRHVKGLHGGGTPVIAFSSDNGQTWTAAKALIENDDAFYVMNDRMIQLRSGRLVLPVARKVGKTEGDRDEGLAMLSDDAGATWRLSRGTAGIDAPRGMAEPCVAELIDGRVLMMGRTGLGSHHVAVSADGGETWSKPEATTLESACSSLTLKTLPDGRLIVFYNHATPIKAGAFFPRTPLCYAVSGDDGTTWSPPVIVDDEGVANKDRQNIYPSICFTKEGMLVMWSTHGADPKGSFAGQYDANIGGGKRAILAMPIKAAPKAAAKPDPEPVQLAASAKPADVDGKSYDLVVFGATSGGIACAVRAAREGCDVLLVQHNQHIGGMMVNGLGQWDALYGGHRAPLFSELLGNIERHYRDTFGEDSETFKTMRFTQSHYPLGWAEPHVAEREFNRLVAGERRITLLLSHYPSAVERDGAMLRSVTLREFGGAKTIRVKGTMFADGSYEGDLLALAKVPYRVGREAREEYQEPHAGKIFTNIAPGPAPRDAAEGRLNIRPYSSKQGTIDPTSPFTADGAVQAYNYRFSVTSDPANRLPFPKPANYNRDEYVNYERKYIASSNGPNHKSHVNSPVLPGENHGYPEGDWAAREKIIQRHLDFALGLMWFLQNDESVPEATRENHRRWGLPKDEFADHNHIPYEMYVRETRRIVGRHVFTERDGSLAKGYARTPVHADSIAITDWYMDSHSCTTDTRAGFKHDGKLILTEESRPAQIPYRSLLPQGVDNLLVPVCLSATHVAWGSVRLEPVFMQVGEAAGVAAGLALKKKTTPALLDADQLVRELATRRFMLSFFNDMDVAGKEAWIPAAQYFGTKGFFADYNARMNAPLTEAVRSVWLDGFKQLQQGTLDAAKLAMAVHAAESKQSPPTGELRADVLLRLWKRLTRQP